MTAPDGGACLQAADHGRIAIDPEQRAWICTTDGWAGIPLARAEVVSTVRPGPVLGYQITATGFPPDAQVDLQASRPSSASRATIGTTDATGSLATSIAIQSCAAAGLTSNVSLVVDGSVLTTQQVTHVSC